MWSKLVLCLCVTLAYASTNPAWRDQYEYIYEVRGRTITGLYEVSDQYSGVDCKTTLKIQPAPDGNLLAKFLDPQCAPIDMPLSDGWKTYIPDSELAWNSVPYSQESFQIRMENGVIKGITVNKNRTNFEVNMIKALVSQLQLKISERPVSSEESLISFPIREDTITGNTETFYKIVRMPDYMALQEPNSEKLFKEKGDGNIYEVTKHKNYTNSVELPSYFYGFAELENGFPATNQMGLFFTRSSFSRAILTGNLNRFTIQNSFTVSEIMVNPTLTDAEKGAVYSYTNLTLIHVGKPKEKIPNVITPIDVDNLVYTYGELFESSNEVRGKSSPKMLDKLQIIRKHTSTNIIARLRRSLEETELLPGSEESYKNEHPDLHEAPESPLLRFTVGFSGQSVTQKVNIPQKVKELTREIANELKNSFESISKGSLNKFTILTSLIRVMDAKEMKTVGDELFSNARKGKEQDAWKIYSDAVAESGTGPALLTIQEWIQYARIEGFEASFMIATMSKSARQPSVQYMKTYFELIKNPKVLSNWPLNDTAILSFSQLVRHVYVDRKYSSSNYPVKSFKNFRTEEGMELLNKTIIPYFAEQLERAVSQAETHKIHVYIRALGNLADQHVLSVLKPYLEGDKQVSQFQRLLMVLAMDKLAEKQPLETRPVLVRLFNNNGETEEVRLAAVMQMMRTHPPKELLQYLASYTNLDKHEHVAAMVKASIETLSKLEGPEFLELRNAAEAAKPLLTKKTFGVQLGANYLRQHVFEELKVKYKENMQLIGSEDHYYPKGWKLSLRLGSAGLKKELINVGGIVSSIKDLFDAFKLQTSSFTRKINKQKQSYEQQMLNPWSSQKIAHLLGLESDEREQLEGNLYYESEGWASMLSFDNGTIPKLLKELTKLETAMQIGENINFMKMSNNEELAIAFPTETGFPFLYTYDTPAMVKIQGKVKATASPRITQQKLQLPDLVEMESDLTVTLNSKIQGRISFITPHDHQQYVSGYNKNLYVQIPLKGKLELDTKNMQVQAQFEMKPSGEPTVLFHRGTIPFISVVDILKFETASKLANPKTRLIKRSQRFYFDKEFGLKETGLVVRVRIDKEKPILDLPKLKSLYSQHGVTAALAALQSTPIEYSNITVASVPQKSRNSKGKIVFKYQYYKKDKNVESREKEDSQELKSKMDLMKLLMPKDRHSRLMEQVNKDSETSEAQSVDVLVAFEGEEKIEYTMFGAYFKSNIQPSSKSRWIYIIQSVREGEEPYSIAMNVENKVENFRGANLEISMQNRPKIKSLMDINLGQGEQFSHVRTQLEFTRSAEREQYLKEQPMYKQCRSEMKDGNNKLPACTNITLSSALLDRISAKIMYESIPVELKETLKKLYYASKFRYFPSTVYEKQEELKGDNELSLEANFDPDLRFVNVSFSSEYEKLTYQNMHINEWVKEVVVLHPVVPLTERITAKALDFKAYRPFCVVDKTKISTFNNVTFPADVSYEWTVMFQYLPKQPRYQENRVSLADQLKYQTENFVVLVKAPSTENGKDVKITINTPETKFKVIDITMLSNGDDKPKIFFNNEEVEINEKKSHDFQDGYIKIYKLPDAEIKVDIKDKFYVIFDGKRVKLVVLSGEFKDATRGICGQFNDEKSEDLLTPANCFLQDHKKFINSYEVKGCQGQDVRKELKSDKNMECVAKTSPLYVEVITSGKTQVQQKERFSECTALRTRYTEEEQEMCFTTIKVPTCVQGCQAIFNQVRLVPVHCVSKSGIAMLWKRQIDAGIDIDFSDKSNSRLTVIEVPNDCV